MRALSADSGVGDRRSRGLIGCLRRDGEVQNRCDFRECFKLHVRRIVFGLTHRGGAHSRSLRHSRLRETLSTARRVKSGSNQAGKKGRGAARRLT